MYKPNKQFAKDFSDATPAGYRVMVRVPRIKVEVDEMYERAKKAGLSLSSTVQEKVDQEKQRVEHGSDTGEVVKIGFQAFKAFHDGEAWCKIGDKILFKKYAGYDPPDQDPDKEYFYKFINDEEVIAIL